MMCERCDAKKGYTPSPYFNHIMHIVNLIESGFPFAQGDLTEAEWLDAGMMRILIQTPDWEDN